MAPARTKKQQTSASSDESIPAFPAPPTMVSTKGTGAEQISTPEKNPVPRTVVITQAQKQALIDNLQLEITERARKLRSQYALQAQGLRSRLEMRVNRIPQGLRRRNMQDLLDEHAERSKPAPPPPMPVASKPPVSSVKLGTVLGRQTLKRTSDQISTDGDKENDPVPSTRQDLANPKKRAKTTTATSKTSRVVSKAASGGVLSPKSQNSRAIPARSAPKPSPAIENSTIAKPSPVKAAAKAVKAAITRTGSRKRGANPDNRARTSESSNTSHGTTVISRAAPKKATASTARKPVAAKATTATRKATAAKKENVVPTKTTGGRTLRNRG